MSRFLRNALSVAAVALLCAGCAKTLNDFATVGKPPPDAALPSPGDSYFVFGVDPPYTRVSFLKGVMDGDQFKPDGNIILGGGMVLVSEPTDGFVLGKAPAGAMVDLDYAQPHSSATSILGYPYSACVINRSWFNPPAHPSETIVFPTPGGKVVYITSLRYGFVSSERLGLRLASDLEGARAFLKNHYPALAGALEQGTYQSAVPERCTF